MNDPEVRPDAARRGFLTGKFLTEQGRQEVRARTEVMGPPPPWFDVKSNHVPSVNWEQRCPQGIIRTYPQDHRRAGEPYLDFFIAGCTFCGLCADRPVAGDDRPRMGRALLDTSRCLAHNGVICVTCVVRCDARAIQRGPRGAVTVDEHGCIGCGACVAPCPASAIRVQPLTLGET
ncbi:MAG: 4Fe-4S binding protein [Chromatiales bacterium]|nr:4Fe-4S binding protein [Chromatiales bacterium]